MAKSTRSTSKLLPQIFQTEKNKKFLAGTLDQLLEPSALEKLSAYVGQRYHPTYRSNDVYIEEVSAERQHYQLEPTVSYKSNGTEIDFIAPYIDVVNEIDSMGGDKTRHDSMWKQGFYSYTPQIDPDKLVNYREYYWVNAGPLSVTSTIDSPGSIITINVTSDDLNGFKFNNKSTVNPDIVIYRGNTYKFVVDTPGHPFYIKDQYGTGTGNTANTDYVKNNGTDKGTVELYIPTSDSSTIPETVLYYQCANTQSMQGRFIIKSLEDETLDINENLLGVNQFTDALGLTYSCGQKITFTGDPVAGRPLTFYVEQVGKSITLVEENTLRVYEGYGVDTAEVWDQNGIVGWDSRGWGESEGVVDDPDYWTINRASQDKNAWSRANRWFHRSVIETANLKNNLPTELSESQRAKRPIVEFVPHLQLFNHGSIGETVDIIDTTTTDALSKLQGSIGLSLDKVTITEGDRIVFINDPEQKNKIFTVHFDEFADGTTRIHFDDDSSVIAENTSITARKGSTQKGKTYHYVDGTWMSSQNKTKLQQKPLFDLFDSFGNSIGNRSSFTSTTFQGSTLFEIATDDTQGTPDTVYGTNVIYKRFGLVSDIQFNDTYNSDNFSYLTTLGLKSFALRQYYAKVNDGNTYDLKNNWTKNLIEYPQLKIEEYESSVNQTDFEIKAWKNSSSISDLSVSVFINGKFTKSYTTKNTNKNLIVRLNTSPAEGTLITIKTNSLTGTTTENGFWELPPGAVQNPKNKNFESFTLGDISSHYVSACQNHPDFTGSSTGFNNSKDLNNFFSYSKQILQHTGNIPLASILARDSVINLPQAWRSASSEYEKIKKNIITTADTTNLNGTVAEQLDLIFDIINANKNPSMAYYNSDMLSYGTNKTTLSYTVEDSNVNLYPISVKYNLETLSNKSVYVYVNNVQLVHGDDYEFTDLEDSSAVIGVKIKTALSVNDVVKVDEYETTHGSYVPSTPAKLGLAPKFKPQKFLDDTYQSEDSTTQGVYVIQGHDGSITVAYNDFRDDLLLEFEKRIYNNIKTNYDPDLMTIDYGFFRNNDYSAEKIKKMFAKEFYTWTGTFAVDYSTNNTYDSGNPFTYNYSQYTNTIDQTPLQGFWRGIYKHWFDTDRPHSHPWEMFGFSEKPSWWDSRYGSAPYTGGNLLLWQDVKHGYIAEGPRKGYHAKFARSGVLNVIPVDDDGTILSPNNAGITTTLTVNESSQSNKWEYGDHGPAETAWRRSSSYRYAEQIAKFLAHPGLYAGIYFDTSRVGKNSIGQYVYNSLYRQPIENYSLPNNDSLTAGYINVLCDYTKVLGYDISYIANRFNNIEINLAYKLGGFSNKDNLNVIVGSYTPSSTNKSVFIPKENYNLFLYKGAPVESVNYSGVIIEKSNGGYKISGYNNFDRSFQYFAPRVNNNSVDIVIGATTESYVEWEAGGFYNKGTVVKNGSTFYRAKNTVTSTQQFNSEKWNVIGNALPLKGGYRVKKYQDYLPTQSTLSYGTVLNDTQSVANFLYGYAEYLSQKGFVFDEFSKELELPIDWDLSTKEFLFWSTQNWQDGAVITLSPSSSKLKYMKANTIGDDLLGINNFYTVLQQDGFPIQPSNLSTDRNNGQFILATDPNQDGIYNADIRAVQKEHVLLLDNETSFKDVIYDDALGVRQDRVKIVGFKTSGWNGDIYSPGYVVDRAKLSDWSSFVDYKKGDVIRHQGKIYVSLVNHNSGENFTAKNYKNKLTQPQQDLLPNFDAKAESFRDFYSLDTDNFDAEQQKYAQHLIGFQNRSYWENLGLDELTQYKFYQGMIRDKGTKKPIERFKSPTNTQDTVDYSIFEEQAFRLGDYGGYRTLESYEFVLSDLKHRQEQQIYQFTQSETDDTQNIINVSASDLTNRPYELQYPIFDNIPENDLYTPDYYFKYPVAGYVQEKQVKKSVFEQSDLIDLDVSNIFEGDRIWVANTPTGDWQIYRASSIANFISFYEARDGILQFTTAKPHGLLGGDYIVVNNFDNEIDGLYQVSELEDSTDGLYKFSVAFDGTFDSTRQNGNILKLTSVRLDNVDDIDDITPQNGFKNGDIVYVDNGYSTGSGKWKIYELNDDSYYESQTKFQNAITRSNDLNYGTSVGISKANGSVFVVGSPGDNSVNIYVKNTITGQYALKNELIFSYLNTDNSDRMGQSVSITDNGNLMFAGSPYSEKIQKLTLSGSYGFTAGQLIYGLTSEAQGRVLTNDTTNNIVYVKLIFGVFTTENIYLEDSSSVATISSVDGTGTEVNQGMVHVITKDIYGSYGINSSIASPNVDSDEYFGWSLSLTSDGAYLFVGAPGKTTVTEDSGSNIGRVYVFKKVSDNKYIHHQTLTAGSSSQNLDGFGQSISVTGSGERLVVGSPSYDRTGSQDSSTYNAGSFHTFIQSQDTYYYSEQEITHGVDQTDMEFGSSVSINSNNDIVVSSPTQKVAGNKQGVVYFYKLYQNIQYGDGSTTSFTVDFDVDSTSTISVTSNGNYTTDYTVSGNVVTFGSAPELDRTLVFSQIKQYQKIHQPSPRANSNFGENVHVNGNRLLIYASGYGPRQNTTFDKISDDGSTLLLETTFDNGATTFSSSNYLTGAVFVYTKLNTKYIFESILQPNDLEPNGQFGKSMASYDNSIIVGAPGQNKTSVIDSTFTNAGQVYRFLKESSTDIGWQNTESQPSLVDISKVNKTFVYNKSKNTLLSLLESIDPAKGKLFGEAEKNISYKTLYDPANYEDWGSEQIGSVWLDISKFKFQWYEQSDLNYRLLNWGKLHPSSVVQSNEWTESDYTPTEYNSLSQTAEGISLGITGTASSNFITKSVFDNSIQQFKQKYYFWVTNPTVIPNNPYRSLSANEISSAIQNPKSFSNEYSAVVKNEAMLVAYNPNKITSDIYLKFTKNSISDPTDTHTEFVLIGKNDPTTSIPAVLVNKLTDSLVGSDAQGRSVPDTSFPSEMRYGILNRPRQSMFVDKNNAIRNMVEFVNDILSKKQYAGSKTLNYWTKKDDLPNQSIVNYKVKVDTDADLAFINTETYITGDKVLVEVDSTAENRWTLYEFNSDRKFDLVKVQEYDTNLYWKYQDFYSKGYDSTLIPDYVVDDEQTMRTTEYLEDTVIKVNKSYDGNFVVYRKTFDGFDKIAVEKGTLAIETSVFDYLGNNIGFDGDTYSENIFDKVATTELRFLIEGLQKDIFTDDDAINFNNLFFLLISIAKQSQKDLDWTFKSSFVKLLSTYKTLEQPPEFRFNTTDAVEEFMQEVFPFKVKIRENLEQHKNLVTYEGDVTDFDNKSYYDGETQTYTAPTVFPGDSTYFKVYNSNPWKFYSDNYKFTIGQILIGTAGEGYSSVPTVTISGGGGTGATAIVTISDGAITSVNLVNEGSGYYFTPTITLTGGSPTTPAVLVPVLSNKKVRSFETLIKFDRLNSNKEITDSVIVDWEPFTSYTTNTNIQIGDKIYRANQNFSSGENVTDHVRISDSSLVDYLTVLTEWSATDRINSYYSPTVGMAGLIGDGSTNIDAYAQLMTGLEYRGTRLASLKFEEAQGFDVEAYDIARYDAVEEDIVDPELLNSVDQIVDSKTFTTSLGTNAEDINVVGDDFISEYSAHAPEEVVPGGVYDTLDMKVYTQPSTGSGVMNKAIYYGDGSTKEFSVPGQINTLDSVRVFKNNQFMTDDSVNYGLDVVNKKIEFTVAPADGDIISIHTVDVSVEDLINESDFEGDGSTTQFYVTVSRDSVTQSYVSVNGVRTPVTLSASNDSVSTVITFGSAPVDGAKIFVYLFSKSLGKAYSEMTTTEYNNVRATGDTVTLNPSAGVIGPFEQKVIVEGVAGTGSENRYRLTPPQIAYYLGDGSTTTFAVPNNPVSAIEATQGTVEVWVNGLYQGDDSSLNSDYTISNDSTASATITLNTAPAVGETVAVMLKQGHDYEISEDGVTLTLKDGWNSVFDNDSSTMNNEKIIVTTFTNHDQMNMRTETFSFTSTNAGDEVLTLSATPVNSSYTFVHMNKENLTANIDYTVDGNKIRIPETIVNNGLQNTVVVSFVSGTVSQPAIGYRIFKDILNRYHYRRLSKAHTTKLSQALASDDTTIEVQDGSVLATPSVATNTPGVVWIGKERITYFTKSGNTLGQLMRGTLGTAITDTHASGSKVVDASLVQQIPYSDTAKISEFTGDGSTVAFTMINKSDSTSFTASNSNELVVTIGGSTTTAYTVDGSNTITFTSAPNSNVRVRVTKKIGTVWYNRGTSTAADGLGLQASTGVEVQFLQNSPAELPEN